MPYPCQPWITEAELEAYDADLAGENLTSTVVTASQILFYLSGRRWPGLCSLIYFPAETLHDDRSRIDLYYGIGYRVDSIVSVTDADAATIPSTDYTLEISRYLHLKEGIWDSHGLGRIAIDLIYGENPPLSGKNACLEFASQVARSLIPDLAKTCRLPSRVSTMTRQGITYDFLTARDLLEAGKTGLFNVDLWLASVNPAKLGSRPRIANPDRKRGIRV